MLPTIESVSEGAPFFIVKRAVVPFFVIKWPQNQIIVATLKGIHCSESDWKLVPDIIDKYSSIALWPNWSVKGDANTLQQP